MLLLFDAIVELHAQQIISVHDHRTG